MYWSGTLLLFVGISMSKQFKVAASFDDYKYENATDTYYKAHQQETWLTAVQICAAEGAFLASPYSLFEATLMGKVFQNYGLDISEFWIGSSSIYSKDAKGPFLTIQGKPMDKELTDWEKGYPINVNVSRCVIFNSITLKMKNVQYNKTYPFMCLKRNYTEPENIFMNYNITATFLGYTSVTDSIESLVKSYREKENFLTAMQVCARDGGKLGAPLNEKELKVYKSLLKDEREFYWLGLTDGFGTRYFNYIDGSATPKPFLNWAPENPDNKQTRNWFVAMNRNGEYQDFTGNVHRKYMFFCAKHKNMTYYNKPMNYSICASLNVF